MTEVVHDKKTINTLFSRYIMDRFELERGSIQVVHETWQYKDPKIKRSGRCFHKQYKYNMDIAPDKTSLSNLEKRDKESMREYA